MTAQILAENHVTLHADPIHWFVVDYDIPREPQAKHRAFYRALHKILAAHNVEVSYSTQSVWIVDSRPIAEEIHALASRYGHSNLYTATRID